MATVVDNHNNGNAQYIIDYLESLKRDNLIKNFYQKNEASSTIYDIDVDTNRKIIISTNLIDSYKAVFEGVYEEWTDYLAPNTSFTELIDWLKGFVIAYVTNDYFEVIYTNKKTNEIVYKKLVFKDQKLGRRQLISYAPPCFALKRLFGAYNKSIRNPKYPKIV